MLKMAACACGMSSSTLTIAEKYETLAYKNLHCSIVQATPRVAKVYQSQEN